MKGSWPKVTCSLERKFSARHSLPANIGIEEEHPHDYLVRAGHTHEFFPERGCTRPLHEMERELAEVVDLLADANLNAVLPFLPTAEVMACWIMARLPAWWMFVEIECYGNYRVRVDANTLRSEWAEKFR